MTLVLPPVELWSFRSFRSAVLSTADTEVGWDWLGETEEALIIDVSYSTPVGTPRHSILVDWYDPTHATAAARKVVAQVNDNAVFWNPVRWFVPRIPESTQRWILRARCSVPGGFTASLDVSVAIARSMSTEGS
jgi:hypothetical protein